MLYFPAIMEQKIVNNGLQEKPPHPLSTFETAEKITKAVALVLAVAYGLGVLISNQYLVTLGVSDFTPLRPKYIITGLWTILLITLASLPIYMPMVLVHSPNESKKRYVYIDVIGIIVGLGCTAGGSFVLFSILNPDVNGHYSYPSFPHKYLRLYVLIWGLEGLTLWLWKQTRTISIRRLQWTVYVTTAVSLCLAISGVTHVIATSMYSHIPTASGGGRPVTGRLILNKDGEAFWAEARIVGTNKPSELQIPFIDPTITSRSRVAKLYYEDEHIMVIGVDNSHGGEGETVTMILNKSLVDAFLIDRKQ